MTKQQAIKLLKRSTLCNTKEDSELFVGIELSFDCRNKCETKLI